MPEGNGGGKQGGDQGQGQGTGQGSGQGQGQGDQSQQSGSNMDPEGEGGDQGQGGDGGQQGQGQGSGDGGQGQQGGANAITAADLDRILGEREQKQFDRLADASGKQIKNVLKDAGLLDKGKGGQQGQGGQGQGDGQQGQGSGSTTEEDTARQAADRKRLVRDARSATRDILSDQVKFMGNLEREDAMSEASALISVAVTDGEEDEEKIGQAVAKSVKERLENRRKFYEERVLASLKRKGLLVETPGQRPASGGTGGGEMAASFAAGRDRARSKYPTGNSENK